MPVVTGMSEWPRVVDGGEELVKVPVAGRPGVCVKMRKSEAIKKGLVKEQAPVRNKSRGRGANKGE